MFPFPRGKVIKQAINLIYKLSPLLLLSKLIPSRSKLLEISLRFHRYPLDFPIRTTMDEEEDCAGGVIIHVHMEIELDAIERTCSYIVHAIVQIGTYGNCATIVFSVINCLSWEIVLVPVVLLTKSRELH